MHLSPRSERAGRRLPLSLAALSNHAVEGKTTGGMLSPTYRPINPRTLFACSPAIRRAGLKRMAHTSPHLASVLCLLLTVVAVAQYQPYCPREESSITFKEYSLKNKKRCGQLTRTECLTVEEAMRRCPCTCGYYRTGSRTSQTYGQNYGGTYDDGSRMIYLHLYRPSSVPVAPSYANPYRCFHGDALVRTNEGVLKMRDLPKRPNVRVLAVDSDGNLTYSPVESWMHADPNRWGTFLTITTESGRSVQLTDLHLIYETDCEGHRRTILARKVSLDRCLLVRLGNNVVESRVVSLDFEPQSGVYAPVTSTGNIVVDDVVASCYSTIEDETLQKIIHSYIMFIQRAFSKFMPASLQETIYGKVEDPMPIPGVWMAFLQLSSAFVPS
ncbi:unnamed protein product [Soboliphyme baturini]|uniref:Protein hedgehog n=1 Tax=Soboliphyme baturini TaxID=241478 RepID=A0A183IN04_9BILA|nr:unnamed protein product [Soboliphyme baturini]